MKVHYPAWFRLVSASTHDLNEWVNNSLYINWSIIQDSGPQRPGLDNTGVSTTFDNLGVGEGSKILHGPLNSQKVTTGCSATA